MAFEFDRIYVIESLVEGERTGQELYNSVIRWFEDLRSIGTQYYSVESKEELISVLEEILSDCASNEIKPLVHLEIHGLPDKSGLALIEDPISWDELSFYLRKINTASNWNLNLTMAVCFGNYFLGSSLNPMEPSPIAGFIGSFEEIFEDDFVPRFDEFYTELRESLNLDVAIGAMMNQNRQFVNGFSYIDARRIFSEVYNRHLEEEFTEKTLEKRYLKAKERNGKLPSSHLEFEAFVKLAFRNRNKYFEIHKRNFFMIDEFPENETRFPITLNEIL